MGRSIRKTVARNSIAAEMSSTSGIRSTFGIITYFVVSGILVRILKVLLAVKFTHKDGDEDSYGFVINSISNDTKPDFAETYASIGRYQNLHNPGCPSLSFIAETQLSLMEVAIFFTFYVRSMQCLLTKLVGLGYGK